MSAAATTCKACATPRSTLYDRSNIHHGAGVGSDIDGGRIDLGNVDLGGVALGNVDQGRVGLRGVGRRHDRRVLVLEHVRRRGVRDGSCRVDGDLRVLPGIDRGAPRIAASSWQHEPSGQQT
jgi:hypothetical protein